MTTPKSLRPRYRYLFTRIENHPEAKIEQEKLKKAVWFEAQNLIGDLGSAETDIKLLEINDDIGIIRCRRGRVDKARAVICCMDSVDGIDLGMRVIGVSGTIRSGVKKYIEGNTNNYVEVEVDGERAFRKNGLIDIPREDTDTNFIGYTANELEQTEI